MLTARQDLLHNVDWLEEVTRRLSEAFKNGKSFYSVNMRSPLVTRAVGLGHGFTPDTDCNFSGKRREDIGIENGVNWRRQSSMNPSESIIPSFDAFGQTYLTDQCVKSYANLDTGRRKPCACIPYQH